MKKNLIEALKNRIHNYAFWTSIVALIPLVLRIFGVYELPDGYDELVNAILTFGVACGIINNPTTDSKWYLDDTKENK